MKLYKAGEEPHYHEVMERLAAQITEGSIVELGSAQGVGARMMCLAATVPVVSVDRYTTYVGLLGGKYGPHVEKQWREIMEGVTNRLGVPPRLIKAEADAAALQWQGPIGLLLVDLGLRAEETLRIIELWEPFVINMIGVQGLTWPGYLDVPEVVEGLLPCGFEDITDNRFIAVLQRKQGYENKP
jgi:hypothetical protein